MIPIYRILAPNFSTSKLFSHSAFLKLFLPLRFSIRFSLSLLIVPCHGKSVGDIRCPSEQVEYVTVIWPIVLWVCGHNGSLWVHPIVVINIIPGYGNINTTTQNTNGEVVLVTVYWSGSLIEVNMVGWIVRSVRFTVSVLSVFEILIDPTIYVVGKIFKPVVPCPSSNS